VAENKYTGADNSVEMNMMIDELNCELQLYCEKHDKVHSIDLGACLSDAQSENGIARRNLAVDGLHFSRYGIKHVACASVGSDFRSFDLRSRFKITLGDL